MNHPLLFWLAFVVAGLVCGLVASKFIALQSAEGARRPERVPPAASLLNLRFNPEMGAILAIVVIPLFGLQYGLNSKADKLDSKLTYESGKSALAEGRLKDALAAFQEAGRLNPRDERVYTSMGVVYFLMAERNPYGSLPFLEFHKNAVESHRKAISINPYYARAYSNLGISLYQLGQKKDAVDAEKRAIELNPETPEAYYNLACMYALEGNSQEALDLLEEAVDHGYENFEELTRDVTLDSIRNTPKYRQLQERVRQKQQVPSSTLQLPQK